MALFINRALFLDRDGVINIDYIDVHKKENFDFVDGIFDLCKTARDIGYKIIVITNQSGVARGVYTEADVRTLHDYMCEEFLKRQVEIADVFTCMNHDNSHIDRKPNPGLLMKAREKHLIDMKASIMVGDKERDVLAGKNAGCGKNIMVSEVAPTPTVADFIVPTVEQVKSYL